MSDMDRHIARLKARGYDWPIPWDIVEASARREGCSLVAYLCPARVPSIGFGETEDIVLGMRWTEDQVDARFYQQIVQYTAKVRKLCTLPPNENQLGALVSLAYNIGLAALAKSSVLRLHNAGDFDGAARAFHLYNKARNHRTGKLEVLPGLVSRRAMEAAIYLRPDPDAPADRMPQAIAEESKLSTSPIAQSGAVTACGGILAGATSVTDQLTASTGALGAAKSALAAVKGVVHEVADIAGVPPGVLLAVALIAAGAVIMRQRQKQRAEGWA